MNEFQFPSRQPNEFSNLLEVLEWQAASRGDRTVYTFEFDDGEAESLTFGLLALRAKAVAGRLQQLASPGDRVVLVFPPGLDFVIGFFGCVAAGVLAVPATYPKPKRPVPRLTAIAQDCQARIALTSSQTLATLDLSRVAPELASLNWMCVDTIEVAEAKTWKPPALSPEGPVFLQYTSGSTSHPKGVIVTHRNLLSNLEMIRAGFGIPWVDPPGQPGIGVFWLPAYHDMGLIGGILSPLYTGGHSVLMAPTSFLQRPARWLQTISRYRALVSGGPNFGYELCVRKIPPHECQSLDLSCWQVAFCGAEPIRAETLWRFAETFGPYGFRETAFYPCYGLAEATLLAAGGEGPASPKVLYVHREHLTRGRVVPVQKSDQAQPLVGCGNGLLGETVKIVDPETAQPAAAAQVGEIWLKGPNVAAGYWNKPEINSRVFQAQVLPDGDGPYLRTGDLGFIHDGQLYVTGRLKEVIIIRGRNYYPQDIELAVQRAHPALIADGGAAFSVEVDGEERLVVVQEVDRRYRDLDYREVIRQIRRAVTEEFDLDLQAIVLIRQASLPRTTSGKIQRTLCREKFLAAQLKTVAEWRRKDSTVTSAVVGPGRLRHQMRSEPRRRMETSSGDTGAFSGPLGDDGSSAPSPVVHEPSSQASGDGLKNKDGDGDGKWKSPFRVRRPMTDAEIRRLTRQIEELLLNWLVERAGVDPAEIDRNRPFAEYGLDSLTAVELTERLEQILNVRLTPTVAWNYPTPAALSEYLAHVVGGRVEEEEPNLPPSSSPLNNEVLEELLQEVESLEETEASTALESGAQEDHVA
jgi:acyl-CoA synthetase (AMP-forming)/AMP-acid ligase II/acyl carrier protein